MIRELLAPKEHRAEDSITAGQNGEEALGEGILSGGEQPGATARSLEETIRKALMGNRKRKLAWLALEDMGKVHRLDGEEASGD